MVEKFINFYKTKKILFFIITFVWLLLIVLLGVFIGFNSKPDVIPLTPEEENSKALNTIKEDNEKILKGETLSTKENLSLDDLQYSRNFVESRKNRSSVRSKAVRSKIGEERLRNREFAWKSNLNTHLHIHDASRRKTFVCKYPNCGKSFYDAQHLKQHEWIHKRTPDVLDLSAREL